ncbi:MAG: hypothetical protein LBJ02_09515 [Bifidobacteriaceae bacterium]|nr:hypothetical protein [Bifidobacteriaceae bacterium]
MLILEELQPGQTPTRRHAMPIVVPDSLDLLRGPAEGAVTLPIWLDWGPDPVYDLSREDDIHTMYRAVIFEATADADVNEWLNAGLLKRIWPDLVLPARHRRE